MKTRKLFLFVTLPSILAVFSGCAPHNYQNDVSSRLRQLYRTPNGGNPMNGYIFGSLLPAVGTLFCTNYADKWPITPDNGCEFGTTNNYFVTTLSDSEKKALLDSIITNVPGGTVSLNDDVTKDVKLDVSIPLIGSIAELSGDAEVKRHTTVTLDGKQAVKRIVNWDPLLDAASNGKLTQRMVDHIQKKDYILAAADIVITGYSVTVKVDNSISADAKAKLDSAFKALASGSNGSVNVSTGNTGTYKADSSDPVVVAALYVRPPAGAGQSGKRIQVTSWPQVHLTTK